MPNSIERNAVVWDFISTSSEKHGAAIGESLGPEAVAGHLIGEFADAVLVDHFDVQLDTVEKIISEVAQDQPDIIGLSIKIGALEQTDQIIQELDQI